jgi:hypothetical protein
MSTLNLNVEGPDIVIDLVKRGLEGSETVLVCPDSIHPGYVLKVAPDDRMAVLAHYTPMTLTNETTVLVRGDSPFDEWLDKRWPITGPAPTLADLTEVALADYQTREGR